MYQEGEVKMKHKKKIYTVMTGINTLICSGLIKLKIYASEGYDLDWITTENNNTFDDLTETVKATGGSLYTLLMSIGVIGLLASLIICGVLIAIGSNANKRSEHLAHLVFIMLGGVVIFGAMAMIGLMQSIGGNL